MKSNMTSRSLGRFLLTVVFASLTLTATMAQAAQTVATPNIRTFSYNLAPGASTGPIAVPASVPVMVMGTGTSAGVRGVGQVTLLSIPSTLPSGGFLEWTGLESTSGSVITQGFSGVLGTHIVFLDFVHQVDIEVASPTAIRVTNSSAAQRTGTVTLIW